MNISRLIFTNCVLKISVAEPKLFIFGSGSDFDYNFGSFLHTSILKTDCRKCLLKFIFGSGSRFQNNLGSTGSGPATLTKNVGAESRSQIWLLDFKSPHPATNARLRNTGYPHVGCRLFCRTKPFWISSGSDSPLKFFRSLPGSLRSFIYVFNNPKSMFLSWALIYNPNFDFLQPFEAYKELLAGGES